jgi:hypothetical protein
MAKFKLGFNCVKIAGPEGKPQRALVIAVATMPQALGWLKCVVACEDGSMRELCLTTPEFEQGMRNKVNMIEVDELLAPGVLYPSFSRKGNE